MKNKICKCDKILSIEKEKIIIHLLGCPKDSYYKEYYETYWLKRLFMTSPESFYKYHFKIH